MSRPQEQDLVWVDAQVPVWLLEAAGAAFPHDFTSDLLRRGLACLTEAEQPVAKVGRHERKDTT